MSFSKGPAVKHERTHVVENVWVRRQCERAPQPSAKDDEPVDVGYQQEYPELPPNDHKEKPALKPAPVASPSRWYACVVQ